MMQQPLPSIGFYFGKTVEACGGRRLASVVCGCLSASVRLKNNTRTERE